jgi:hypothetical protein
VWENPGVRDDGALVVHTTEPGYRVVLELAAQAAAQVDTYVHVVTDDAPAARPPGAVSESHLEWLNAALQRAADLVPSTLAHRQAEEVHRLAMERL